jgi:hypothetical protein
MSERLDVVRIKAKRRSGEKVSDRSEINLTLLLPPFDRAPSYTQLCRYLNRHNAA